MAKTKKGSRGIKVLDTNVLIHDPRSFERFPDCDVVIPIEVIKELDGKKNRSNGVGASAREATRNISKYRINGNSLKKGVPLKNGGKLYVDYEGCRLDTLPLKLDDTPDSRILAVAMQWRKKNAKRKKDVVLISKDLNLLITASTIGLDAQDYTIDRILSELGDLYSGFCEITIPDACAGLLSEFNEKNKYCLAAGQLAEFIGDSELTANQCCRIAVKGNGKNVLAIFDKPENAFKRVYKPRDFEAEGELGPRNEEQALAYSLLMDPGIKIVTLVGKAGTGKSLLALLAADRLVGKSYFSQWCYFRPTLPLGEDLGFLPGDLSEKFRPWADAIFDNYFLIWKQRHDHRNISEARKTMIEELIHGAEQGVWEFGPINYLRGRTKTGAFVIIDEAQNLTPHQVKTLVTRAGEGTKLVLTGDPEQIDNQYLDATSNGLVYLVERFKGQEIYGHITLKKGERSGLAELGATLL